MKRLAALALLAVVLLPGIAWADSSSDAALALGAFAVFNQIVGGVGVFGAPARPVVLAPAPVVYVPPPVVYAPPPPPVYVAPQPVYVIPSQPVYVTPEPVVVYRAYGHWDRHPRWRGHGRWEHRR